MIGIPTVTRYGSSYGTFGGARLSNYQAISPDTTILNNQTEVKAGEFTPFEESIKDYILAKLGHPTVKVELTNMQIRICIEEAISRLDYHAPQWNTQYAVFNASAGINVYELPAVVINNLTDVWYRRNLFTLGATPGSLEYDFAIMFFTNTGLFNNYNVGQYLLMQMYLKQIRKVLGQATSWNIINGKYLQLFPVPDIQNDPVILEFRALDANTMLPAMKNWIQRFACAKAKEILGRVRGKFAVLPGPNGGTKLDGEQLTIESKEESVLLLDELRGEIEQPPLFIMA